MGRSVIPHPHATVTAYIEFSPAHPCINSRDELCDEWGPSGETCDVCADSPEFPFCDAHCDHSDDWEDFLEWVVSEAQRIAPSLQSADRDVSHWNYRTENRVILENRHSEVSVSEYCGLVAISLAPRSDWEGYPDENSLESLGAQWRARIAGRFASSLGTLRKLGTFSNGESVYRAA